MAHNSAHWMSLLAVLWLTLVGGSPAVFGQQDPPRPMSPTVQMQTLLRQLREEAIAAQKGQKPMRDEASFALETTLSPPPNLISQNLIRTQHRDPFIDAYIRWQLTGFDPPFPDLPKRKQQDVLRKLPTLTPNPLSNPAVLSRINELLQIPILSEQEQAQIITEYTKLTESQRRAAKNNVPATKLRMWLIKSFPPTSRAALEIRVELVATMVGNGWTAVGPKNLLQSSCEMAGKNQSLSKADRESIAQLLQKITGLSSTMIEDLRTGDFALQANFRSSTIQDFEVREWTRLLYGQDGSDDNQTGMQP